jgi:hypothetical protein
MQRELFSVEPASNGWRVMGNLGQSPPHTSKFEAYEHARELAYARHVFTGHPTAVIVQLQCGDVVMADPHG